MHQSDSLPGARLNFSLRRLPATSWAILAAWTFLFGTYAVVSFTARHGRGLTAFGDIAMLVAALFASVALLLNVRTGSRRARAFWILMAAGCLCWFVSQLSWTYFEVILQREMPNPFIGDVIVFLHPVPMIAALVLRPHDRRDDLKMQLSYVDFSLMVLWWIYLYVFMVIPWQYVAPNVEVYGQSYNYLAAGESLLLAAGFGVVLMKARGKWREIYAHLFSASLMYAVGSYITNHAIDAQSYYTGSPSDLPLVGSFVWFGMAGIVAYALKPQQEDLPRATVEESPWAARLAAVAVVSIPCMAISSLWFSANPPGVRTFRVGVSQIALIAVAVLLFVRQRLVDGERLRLLQSSREAFENLKHFQAQMVQNEKLVSIGALAAGAAHEINNPLTGILGYSDLLADDAGLDARQRAVVDKIRTLARRIKTLVTSLLSFARKVPAEKGLLDLNQVIQTALHLSNLDLRNKRIEIETLPDPELPPVHGDANQLLQVCFNLMSNAADALEEVGGGKLTIRTDHDLERVLVEFADTGPGIKSPQQVFDPFFTTKPVGKGTGLGLSICYGILQEHGGRISCWNRAEGGATFLFELPSVPTAATLAEAQMAPSSSRST